MYLFIDSDSQLSHKVTQACLLNSRCLYLLVFLSRIPYVLLLQNVVEENRLLREQMATMITNSENALKNLNKKIESMATSNVERRVRHTRPTIPKVPKPCSMNVNSHNHLYVLLWFFIYNYENRVDF